MNPVETYIREMRDIRASGAQTDETSFYTPLANLLNEIGRKLKPKVRCLMNLKNQGAGFPDGGLFTAGQFRRKADREPLPGQKPERGAIEVKSTAEGVGEITRGEQVSRYLAGYGLVLVTNYRDFVLARRDESGAPVLLERCTLAKDEDLFWETAQHPRKMAEEHGERLVEYLARVMLHAASLGSPKDVAWFLASYARDARHRVERSKLAALASVRSALEEALGLKFEGEKGERFFRSTLVQTLFYGVFSAWVLWSKKHAPTDRKARFNWHEAAWELKVPVIRALFEQVATPTRLGPLKLDEVLDWTAAVLNRVDRAAFFEKFEEEHAVQYFYEPFLEAFDPKLRKELGVWYTPPEIVEYMVARVDTVLREELGLADGLADERVFVLDPCCGTGAYLVEVLKRIAATLKAKGGDALSGGDVKTAAIKRVFGFEILPAPFVVSHLQLGLLLRNLGAPLSEKERAGVYLTNALTGWEPPDEIKKEVQMRLAAMPELKDEHDAAERVKRDTPILVVLGNPPYNGFAGAAMTEERDLTTAYRTTNRAPAPQGQGLNDLYIRFFRMAERRITEMKPRKGIVCFISNYSWLDGLSFPGMREKYLEAFDRVWVDCLNGDKYKTGKLTPEGEPDPSVFSTEYNREGIQVGTAIALLARKEKHTDASEVRFRHLWGKTKRQQLVETAEQDGRGLYETVKPVLEMGLSFMPSEVASGYFKWPLLPELFPVSFPGVKTSRDDLVVDIDRERLVARMENYFDPDTDHEEMARIAPCALASTARFKAKDVRDALRKRGFLPDKIVRYCYRPFDVRWLYWEPETKLLDEKREDYFPHVQPWNVWIEARQRQPKEDFDRGYFLRVMGDNFGSGLSSFFPFLLFAVGDDLFDHAKRDEPKPNLTDEAAAALKALGFRDARKGAEELFYHALAVLHAPAYREENGGALRQDWPRVPLPATKAALLASAKLGREVAALLDTESPVKGVTEGRVRPELAVLGAISREGGGTLDPSTGELAVTAGWGHAGQRGVTMPGRGKSVERKYEKAEREAVETGAKALGLAAKEALKRLGGDTLDVYLNEIAYWKNVPAGVWDYHIGGYQVVKKWLSYREKSLLGRDLTTDEAREVTNMVRRIAAIRLLESALDANYRAVKKACVE